MKGLLIKEWCILRGQNRVLPLAILFILVMALLSKSSILLCYIPMILGMMPMTMMSVDEVSNWEKYALALPYSRRTIVTSKYLMCILSTLVSLVLVGVPLWFAFRKIAPDASGIMFCAVLVMQCCAALLLPSLMLPLNFKFGAAKSRIISMLELMLICMGLPMLSGFINVDENSVSLFGVDILQFLMIHPAAAILILLAAIALLVAISWSISVAIYSKREF